MPAASGWTTSKRRSSLWIFRIISRRCLRFISFQWRCVEWLVDFLVFSDGLGFMLASSMLNSTWLGPVGGTYTISPAGSGLLLSEGPFREFYEALVAKGMRPEMARLTLARKIAAIALTVW